MSDEIQRIEKIALGNVKRIQQIQTEQAVTTAILQRVSDNVERIVDRIDEHPLDNDTAQDVQRHWGRVKGASYLVLVGLVGLASVVLTRIVMSVLA